MYTGLINELDNPVCIAQLTSSGINVELRPSVNWTEYNYCHVMGSKRSIRGWTDV